MTAEETKRPNAVVWFSIVTLSGLLVAFIVSRAIHRQQPAIVAAHFQLTAEKRAVTIPSELSRTVEFCEAVRRLYLASENVEEDELAKFAQNQLSTNGAVRALAWVPWIAGETVSCPVTFVAPQGPIGLDLHLLSQRAVLDRACESGAPAVTGGLALVKGGADETFLVASPLYRNGEFTGEVSQRLYTALRWPWWTPERRSTRAWTSWYPPAWNSRSTHLRIVA